MATAEAARSHLRAWLVLTAYLLVIAVLIGLPFTSPWLDPAGSQGGAMRTAMIAAWVAALGVLTLGLVRERRSQFTLRTSVILTAVVAVFLRLYQTINPVVPTMLLAAGLSVTMLHEAGRGDGESRPFRGRLSRIVMAVGVLLFLAHFIRVAGSFLLLRLGWLTGTSW
jgi:hypothetical protein